VRLISRDDAAKAFSSGNTPDACKSLVSLAFYETDWHWVQNKCLEFAKAENDELAGVAITCIGHLARIHKKLDLDIVLPVLDELGRNPKFKGRVEDALDDIKMYMGE